MQTVSYSIGTAPASLVVVQGVGRALNPTARSGRGNACGALSGREYDHKTSRHRSGLSVNNFRTEAFDTPVRVWEKNTGWMTVAGGKDGLTITFAPDAIVKYAEVITKTGEVIVLSNITLNEYMHTYC